MNKYRAPVDAAPRALRVLHSAGLLSPSLGMLNQMKWESRAAKLLNLNWRTVMYCTESLDGYAEILHVDGRIRPGNRNNVLSRILGWVRFRVRYYRWLKTQERDYDILLLRYYVHDPFQYWFVTRSKKPVYFVHHSLEVPELKLELGLKGFVRSRLEWIIGALTLSRAHGIIGVTAEIVSYENRRSGSIGRKKNRTYIYPNGVVYDEQATLEDKRSTDLPEILFVANFAPWHGLDRLLKSVSKSNANFVLHLVGKLPKDIEGMCNDERINIHGELGQEGIIEVIQRSWVGLSLFALDRKNMAEACTLKVREYLKFGLPVYGQSLEVFPDDAKYYRFGGPAIEEIVEYARLMRTEDRFLIAAEARPYIEKCTLLAGLYNWLLKDGSLQ